MPAIGVIALATPAGARPGQDTVIDLPACGARLPITRALLDQAGMFTGTTTRRGNAVLIATLRPPMLGTLAFVRTQRSWRAYAIEANGAVQGVFATSSGDVFAWSMLSTEGPGSSYRGMSIGGATGSRFCTGVRFPASLNQPAYANEYLSLHDFNIDRRGRGAVVGLLERDVGGGSNALYYRYATVDHGRRWQRPVAARKPAPVAGRYRALPESLPAEQASPQIRALIGSLQRR